MKIMVCVKYWEKVTDLELPSIPIILITYVHTSENIHPSALSSEIKRLYWTGNREPHRPIIIKMDLSAPVDRDYTKALPKVELHAHLSGSISRQCLHEIWKRKKTKNPNLTVEDPLILMPVGKVDYTLQTGNTTPAEAMQIIDLAIANKVRGVVGIDICGNPNQGNVSIYRDAFARAKAHKLGLTLHFAETPASGAPSELTTLLSFQPDRLGHVIHVPDDFKAEISKRGFGDHHFGYWRHQDVPIALCTDDVGFFCSPVSNEYLLAAEHFGLDRTGLLNLCRKSVDIIFGGEQEKKRLLEILDTFNEVK
ncbi:hypothetical protein N7495_002468 [Penicillium taxi]|uniref:uncharacterized protein n=1 Tax=Penicillium taxi TaxID=168475 RepID=UPI002544F13A|nr:uncharacterized protein N7495_002468 [Penicillium taxi]KAJ5901940.1 hypothetical protein N7495_002468 [Penicillium taxi]